MGFGIFILEFCISTSDFRLLTPDFSRTNEHRKAFDKLFQVNDNTLSGNSHQRLNADRNAYMLLIPVVGMMQYTTPQSGSVLLEPGELQLLSLKKEEILRIDNPYATDAINYLQLSFEAEGDRSAWMFHSNQFDLDENQNNLSLLQSAKLNIAIGKFTGREEALYHLQENSSAFIWVIDGVFEVNGCLLHARDALTIRNEKSIDMEALSNEAIILIVEIKNSRV